MSVATSSRIVSTIPVSSHRDDDSWSHVNPEKLIKAGYVEPVDLAPPQSQIRSDVETSNSYSNPPEKTITAGVYPQGNLWAKLLPALPRPVTGNWVTLHALQEWEGYVIGLTVDGFSARLIDVTEEVYDHESHELIEEEAEIPLTEISEGDVARLEPGAVFRWVIGYERKASGTKRRISQIIFRDMPALTQRDRSDGIAWARKISDSLRD